MILAVLFKNVHQIMMAEDLLNSSNIECDLVPVPREISSECGLAMILEDPFINSAMKLIYSSETEVQETYKVVDGIYEIYDFKGDK
jgi:hypothetical protein